MQWDTKTVQRGKKKKGLTISTIKELMIWRKQENLDLRSPIEREGPSRYISKVKHKVVSVMPTHHCGSHNIFSTI